MRSLARALLVTLVTAGAARPGAAQWHIGVEAAVTGFRGGTRDTSGSSSGAHLRPGPAAGLGLRIARDIGRASVAIRGSLARPGIAAVAGDVTFLDRTDGDLVEVAGLVGLRIAGVGHGGAGGALRVEAGPAVGLWDMEGEIRARVAALAAVAYEWPVAGRFSGAIRLEGGVGPSPFENNELPPELERRPVFRYGVTLGASYRL